VPVRNAERASRITPLLTEAAGHRLGWILAAAALWATGDRWARRAAWRGLGSMAAAGSAASLLGWHRAEPFPSRAAASAVAFATGVAIEVPALAPRPSP
jgi:undecaprenyl-diphosphatase